MLTEREVADRLAVSTKTLQQWRWLGRGPSFVRLGRAVRYRPEDVDAYVERNVVATREVSR